MLAKIVKCGMESFWIGGITPTITQRRGSAPTCKFELIEPCNKDKLDILHELCKEDDKGFKIVEYTINDNNQIVPFIEYNGCLFNEIFSPLSSVRKNDGYFLSEKVVMGKS
jgi:hypothetical protein